MNKLAKYYIFIFAVFGLFSCSKEMDYHAEPYQEGKEDELMGKLQKKLGKTKDEVRRWKTH